MTVITKRVVTERTKFHLHADLIQGLSPTGKGGIPAK